MPVVGNASLPSIAGANGGTLVSVYASGVFTANQSYACSFSSAHADGAEIFSKILTVDNYDSISCLTPFWVEAAEVVNLRVCSWRAKTYVVSPTLVDAGEEIAYTLTGAGLNHRTADNVCELKDLRTGSTVMSVLSSAVNGDTMRCPGMSWEYSADLVEVSIKMRSILIESH